MTSPGAPVSELKEGLPEPQRHQGQTAKPAGRSEDEVYFRSKMAPPTRRVPAVILGPRTVCGLADGTIGYVATGSGTSTIVSQSRTKARSARESWWPTGSAW